MNVFGVSRRAGDSVSHEFQGCPPPAMSVVSGSHIVSSISADVIVCGTISCREGIRINCRLEGDIKAGGVVEVGPEGEILGDVLASDAVIFGSVTGNIVIDKTCSLEASAKVNGNITTNRLSMKPGASFVGSSMTGVTPCEDD